MIDVHIPKMGMSTVEVDIVTVMVQPGARVAVGDSLIEVETEKVSSIIESEHAGTVGEVLVAEGETYEVGHVFCRIEPDA